MPFATIFCEDERGLEDLLSCFVSPSKARTKQKSQKVYRSRREKVLSRPQTNEVSLVGEASRLLGSWEGISHRFR